MRHECDKDWVPAANRWLSEFTWKHDAKSLLLPVGKTHRKLYAAWRKDPPLSLTRMKLMQLDEIITGPKAGHFARTLAQELPGLSVDLPHCYIPADLAILGLGINGHVAFHEPGLPFDWKHGEVILSESTAASLGVAYGTKAITYGVRGLLACKALLLIVTGTRKRSILKRCLEGEDLPATALLKHEDIKILTDFPLD